MLSHLQFSVRKQQSYLHGQSHPLHQSPVLPYVLKRRHRRRASGKASRRGALAYQQHHLFYVNTGQTERLLTRLIETFHHDMQHRSQLRRFPATALPTDQNYYRQRRPPLRHYRSWP